MKNEPKPGKRHKFCGLCKQLFEDYLEHINSEKHRRSFEESPTLGLIKQKIKQIDNERNSKEKSMSFQWNPKLSKDKSLFDENSRTKGLSNSQPSQMDPVQGHPIPSTKTTSSGSEFSAHLRGCSATSGERNADTIILKKMTFTDYIEQFDDNMPTHNNKREVQNITLTTIDEKSGNERSPIQIENIGNVVAQAELIKTSKNARRKESEQDPSDKLEYQAYHTALKRMKHNHSKLARSRTHDPFEEDAGRNLWYSYSGVLLIF
eukprot:TRINITY_DN338_c0_g1_i3.p1 TRINITY_DN338_c0_g1~~TRINITY_DN338_c0_g1_i3.p1  ORF type:complete len:263 (+),score=34.76 TRINITY_DN338_c0_g1_i3:345-1133(+)